MRNQLHWQRTVNWPMIDFLAVVVYWFLTNIFNLKVPTVQMLAIELLAAKRLCPRQHSAPPKLSAAQRFCQHPKFPDFSCDRFMQSSSIWHPILQADADTPNTGPPAPGSWKEFRFVEISYLAGDCVNYILCRLQI